MLPTLSRRAAGVRFKPQTNVAGFTAEKVSKWTVPLGIWGGGAAVAVGLFFSGVPIFQADVLKKIPFVASYYQDTTPDSDKPF